jgi:CubicO group peptidase (beta-lactamase class C family)
MIERIEAFVRRELEDRRIPGAAIAVVRPGEPVWSQGFGTANLDTGEPFTAETPFSIQSITKTFVGTAIMQLDETGALCVDDPVADHLPGVVQNEWEPQNPVRIRHLLTHTAGFPVDTAGGPPGGPRPLDEFVRLVAKTVRPPESGTVYANWGYDVAGLVIEAVSKESWHGYITKHICEPLGMSSTSVHPPENAAYGSYLSAVDGEFHRLMRAQWPVEPSDPAGGLVSNVEDLSLFASAHLAGGRAILKSETAARMHAVAAEEPGGGGMGLGFRVTRSNGRRLLCHGGDGSGFTNFLGLYPDEGVAVVLTLSRGGAQAARSVIANSVLAMAAGDDPSPRRVLGAPSKPPVAEGLYRSAFWDIDVVVEAIDDGLTARPISGLVVSDGPQPSTLVPAGDGNFVAEGGMFGGFGVTLGDDGALYGGLYPNRFVRAGDVPVAVVEPIDEAADLAGHWKGIATTPMGDLSLTLNVAGGEAATISTPFAQGVPLEECRAEHGRFSGRFTQVVPGVGEMAMHPRLEARGGRLKGTVYAQSWFGELAMPAELEKA